jgi:hypothetical protein
MVAIWLYLLSLRDRKHVNSDVGSPPCLQEGTNVYVSLVNATRCLPTTCSVCGQVSAAGFGPLWPKPRIHRRNTMPIFSRPKDGAHRIRLRIGAN